MKIVNSWGLRCLAAYLILVGLLVFVPTLPGVIAELVVPLLAVAAGVLILIGR